MSFSYIYILTIKKKKENYGFWDKGTDLTMFPMGHTTCLPR